MSWSSPSCLAPTPALHPWWARFWRPWRWTASRGAPVALAKSKEAILRGSGRPLEEAFAIESQCTKENAATDDAKEGPRAFLEKREPVFTGRTTKP